jgi:hypothetical protein
VWAATVMTCPLAVACPGVTAYAGAASIAMLMDSAAANTHRGRGWKGMLMRFMVGLQGNPVRKRIACEVPMRANSERIRLNGLLVPVFPTTVCPIADVWVSALVDAPAVRPARGGGTTRESGMRGRLSPALPLSIHATNPAAPQCLRQVSAFFHVQVSRPVWITGGTVLPSARSRITIADL